MMTDTTSSVRLHNLDVASDFAKHFLGKLNTEREKTDVPVKPIIGEVVGFHKAGKDSNLVVLDRWFRRRGYRVLITQESAETKKIRAMTRTNPYVYEMGHFAYTFSNFIEALTSRDFHAVFLNRGFIDTLCWLESHRRQNLVSNEQFEQFRSWVLNGPWLEGLDVVVCLMCSVETSLRREYGTTENVIYGSRMNPESLTLMRDCVESVLEYIGDRHPNLAIIKVNTDNGSADRTISETSNEIIMGVLNSVRNKMKINDDEIIAHSPALLRELAKDFGRQEIKFNGSVSIQTLLKHSWLPQGAVYEIDTYLTPKGHPALENDECFHFRFYGENKPCYLMYKGRNGVSTRLRNSVPILPETMSDFFEIFEKVAVIEKERQIFVKGDMVIALDKIDGLGEFTEMRAPVSSNIETETEKLGLTSDRMVPETYIRLFLKNQSR